MSIKHGVYVAEEATAVSAPVATQSGIPFVIGASPIQSATNPAAAGVPVVCNSLAEFTGMFGYSDDWDNYPLCEFAYSHFVLYGAAPAIFVNVLDLATMTESVAADDLDVADHKVILPVEAIDDDNLVVKASGGAGTAYEKGTDYEVYYNAEGCVVELLSGTHYSETSLNIAYKKAKPASVTDAIIATGLESIEMCMGATGVIPDLICAPGHSGTASVAAVMATKAAGINGLFKAKALIDVSGAATAAAVANVKATNNLTDENEILCWPKIKLGEKTFHMSTALAGVMAQVDSANECPYESPSNKQFAMDALVDDSGNAVTLTKAQADGLNAIGVVTALNFLSSGWVAWGNYTACYPASTDVKDYFIPVSRMFDFVSNTLIRTFWSKLDKPVNRRLVDSILDSCNIWLNGLVGSGYLLGAQAVIMDGENPLTDLLQGIVRIHIYMTPPSPAQEIDFTLEYDASYLETALA